MRCPIGPSSRRTPGAACPTDGPVLDARLAWCAVPSCSLTLAAARRGRSGRLQRPAVSTAEHGPAAEPGCVALTFDDGPLADGDAAAARHPEAAARAGDVLHGRRARGRRPRDGAARRALGLPDRQPQLPAPGPDHAQRRRDRRDTLRGTDRRARAAGVPSDRPDAAAVRRGRPAGLGRDQGRGQASRCCGTSTRATGPAASSRPDRGPCPRPAATPAATSCSSTTASANSPSSVAAVPRVVARGAAPRLLLRRPRRARPARLPGRPRPELGVTRRTATSREGRTDCG